MHTLIASLSVAIIVVGSYLQLRFLLPFGKWRSRLPLYLVALATPSLLVGLMFISFPWKVIPWDSHLWHDHSAVHLLAWSVAAVAAGGLGFSLGQGILASIVVRRYPKATDPALLGLADRVAAWLGIHPPTLRTYDSAQPVAQLGAVMGVDRYILLSSWIVSNLDKEEREAVLAHEMAHIRRRDDLVIWVAQLLRDVTFYVPALRKIWLQLQLHMQVACDELASRVTGQRLALASALLKAGRQALNTGAKPRWALDSGLLSAFSSSSALGKRVALLTGETEEVALGERPRWGNLGSELLVATTALQGLGVAAAFHFFCCQDLDQHPIMVVVIFALSGLFLAVTLARVGRSWQRA